MRRYNIPEESVSLRDPAEEELEKAIKLLKPIRQHRMLMAERQAGREKRRLAELRTIEERAQTAYQQAREELPGKRRDLAAEYQDNKIPLESLDQWKGRETRLVEDVQDQYQEARVKKKEADEQEQRLEKARQEVMRQQREAERMKFMEEELNG
ncbi:hypothetical protein ACKC9G_15975 [Pokkaliibacter sp. CJK22405]|uniref:hypothetical protein n=1 Tax=Pokkaliibacter sp. CJK22405 TaxID=3384615 RepID=UPI0039853E50